jgi:hypothetical protein
MKYMCKCCDYSTEDKSNFNKHITSRKHKLVESKATISSPSLVENYQCSCNEKLMKLIELNRAMNDRLEKQEKQLNEQKLQIDNIISEIF